MSDSLGLLDNIDQLAPKRIGIQEFVESDQYAGIALYPRQTVLLKLLFLEEMTGKEEDVLTEWINGGRNGSEIVISPNIRERRQYLRDNNYKHFREIQFAVGRRASKGFMTGAAMAYTMWTALQLGNPGEYYGIDRKKEIYFSCIAGSESQAKKFQYADMVARIESNKAFQPYIADSLETEIRIMTPADIREISASKARGQTFRKDQARLRGNALAANAGTLRGSATMALVIDEAAHMIAGESKSSAQEVYNAAGPSLDQFAKDGMLFCNPPESPIWMSDLSFKSIGEVKIGDKVVGWDENKKTHTRDLCESTVINVAVRQSPIVKVTLESGRSFRCTPDHRWLTSTYGGKDDQKYSDGIYTCECGAQYGRYQSFAAHLRESNKYNLKKHSLIDYPENISNIGREWFCVPKVGRKLIHVIDPTPELQTTEEIKAATWLAGMFDGEGHASKGQPLSIAQYKYNHPAVCNEIERCLSLLGFNWKYDGKTYRLVNDEDNFGSHHLSKQICTNFVNWCRPIRANQIIKKVLTGRWRKEDQIISVEPDGFGEVIALTTTTGNYVCHGYASKNCNSSPYSKVGMFHDLYQLGLMPFDPTRPVDLTTVELMGDDGELVEQSINGDPRRMVFQGPSWALFQGYRYYTSKYKPRERGKMLGKMVTVSPDWNPEDVDEQDRPLFSEEDKAAIIQARASEAADPETYKVERRGKFAEISEAWLNPSMVDRMYHGRPIGLVPQPNGDMVMGYEPLYTNYGVGINTGGFRYKFHLDPSSTTAGFGFAIGHIEYLPDPVTGVEVENCVFDLIKRWNPAKQPGKVIRWKPIIDEIITLAKIFHPFEITMDQHQSSSPLQEIQDRLNQENISCQVYTRPSTAELNWKKCEVFKTALYQGLVHAPQDEEIDGYTSKEELKFLQQVQTSGKYPRVDKQDLGPVQTKDMSDAIIDVVWALMGNLQLQTMRERLAHSSVVGGSPGGYGMGRRNYPSGAPMPMNGDGNYYYSQRNLENARAGKAPGSPTRGAIGMRRQGCGSRISTRGRH